MRRYIALLLVLVMLLAACGTAHPSDNTSNPTNTEQNGTAPPQSATSDPTQGTTAPIPTTNPTGDSSSTGTTEATQPPTDAPTVPPTTPTTTPTTETTVPVEYTLKISQNTLSLEVGQIGNLTVEYTGTGTLTWSSSNTSIVTVSNGKVTAKAAGNAVITVTDGVKNSQCYVTVTKPVTETPKEVTLKLNKSSLNLKVGSSETLSVTYTGNKSLTWNSTNSSIASVSNGKVTAKSVGTVTIEVGDGVKKAQCIVTVTNVETPKEVKLSVNPTSLNLVVGNTSTLTYEYTGTGTLSWSSSNTSIVTVSNGKVTAKAAGTAVVTVSDGTKQAQCVVTVTNPAPAVEVKLTVSPATLNLVVGNTSTLTTSYNGTGTLSWSSDNTSVITVSNGKVTAKAAGTARVTVTDGSKMATCDITVTAPATTTFKINTKAYTVVIAGNTLQIDYTYSGDKSKLTWTSNDTNVMTVDGNGKVTAKAAGSTIIKVTDGSSTKRVVLVVEAAKPLATSLLEDSHNAPLYDGVVKYAGDYMTFRVNVKPDESNPNITVTSSNNSVVSVSWELNSFDKNNVTLNFKSAGTATITITSVDGAKSKSYTITVKGDYSFNPGGGQLTPEQFVDCFNAISKANGMSNSYVPSGYLVLTLSPSELTWSRVRREAEAEFHHWYSVGKTCLVLTYEETNDDGNYVFYVHR